MSERDTITARTVGSFLEGYVRQGRDPGDILEQIGEPRTLLQEPGASLPVDKVSLLIAAISLELRDEALGFLERPIAIGGLQMSVHATITSRTLREAMDRWNLFWSLAHDYEFCAVSVRGDEANLNADFPRGDSLDRSAFITWTALFVLRWSSWLIGKPVLLDRLCFPFDEPENLEDYSDMFACRHYFGHSRITAVFNKRFLEMPVIQSAETVPTFVRMIPDLMTVERVDRSLTAQIKRMLHTTTNNVEALPLKVVADQLDTSQDTIRRHLKREGSSYAEIKESVRRDLAIYHLKRRDTPIGEIATMVGFSEPSAFSRAFKKWTGQTPGDYRSKSG